MPPITYVQDETGEAMIGLVVPGNHTNGRGYSLRAGHHFARRIGSASVAYVPAGRRTPGRDYLVVAGKLARSTVEKRRNSFGNALQAKWDVPLRYLGDWHKQPGFMIAPSGGDQQTALNWLYDESNNMDFLLAPIVTLGHPSTTFSEDSTANFVTAPQDDLQHIRIDFWYIDREVGLFQPIHPAIYPDDQLPGLPAYPWHLTDRDRANREFGLLHDDDLFSSIVLWNATDEPPLEVCFMAARVGSDRVLIVITPWNYPEQPPSARVAPFVQMGPEDDLYDVFEDLWSKSQIVKDPPGWAWSEEKTLVDYIHALENALGMKSSSKSPEGDDKDDSSDTQNETADEDVETTAVSEDEA